jgi:hypothetical protein
MPDGTGMFLRQIPAYAGLTSGHRPGGGGMIAVGIDLFIMPVKYSNFLKYYTNFVAATYT